MPKLTDTQLIILAAAAKREDRCILPLPRKVKLEAEAAADIFKTLIKRKLAAERPATASDSSWRETSDGQRVILAITEAGLRAIGVDSPGEGESRPAAAGTKKLRNRGSNPKSSKPRKSPPAAKPRQKGHASRNRIRAGTKQAGLIEILRRPMGHHPGPGNRHGLAGPFRARRHLGRAEEEARHDGGVGEERKRRAALPLGGVATRMSKTKHAVGRSRHDGDGHGDPVVVAASASGRSDSEIRSRTGECRVRLGLCRTPARRSASGLRRGSHAHRVGDLSAGVLFVGRALPHRGFADHYRPQRSAVGCSTRIDRTRTAPIVSTVS
jgi:hypothetical protein